MACEPSDDCSSDTPRDTVVLVDPGTGWEIVGAKLPSWGLGYWYGEPKTMFIVGSDANYGENQDSARADSIHIFTLVPDVRSGAIVGIPRDSWVQGPNGRGKINGILADSGPEALMNTVASLTGLEFDGYLLTGFTGFVGLINNFGDVTVDLPKAIDSGVSFQADYPAGEQTLGGDRLLWLARIRKTIAGGDLGRSANGGMIMLAGLMQAQPRGILELPWHVRNMTVHVSTDLTTAELAQLGAMLFEIDPSTVPNIVLPASVGTVGSASVVFLSSRSEDVYRDLDDGLLNNDS
jgi:LCP family protein required for cell wall assembly